MNHRQDLAIKLKIMAVVLTLVASVVVVGGVGIVQMSRMNTNAAELRDDWLPWVSRIDRLVLQIERFRRDEGEALLALASQSNVERAERFLAQAASDVDKAYKDLAPTITPNTEDEQLMKQFVALWPKYRDAALSSVQRAVNGDLASALKDFNEEHEDLRAQIMSVLAKDAALNEAEGKRVAHEGAETFASGRTILLVSLGAAGLFGIFAAGSLIGSVLTQSLQREGERQRSFLLELSDALEPLKAPSAIIATACELVGRNLGVDQVVFAEINPETKLALVKHVWGEGRLPNDAGVRGLEDYGDHVGDLQAGRTVAISDTVIDARTQPIVRARGIGALVGVPLVKHGWLVGIVWIHHGVARQWSATDLALIEEAVKRTSAAMDSRITDEAMRASEERLRVAMAAANAGVWEWDLATNALVWSDELWRLYGIEPGSCEPSIDVWLQTVHSDDRAHTERAVKQAVARSGELIAEWRTCEGNGAYRWLLAQGGPMRRSDQTIQRYIGVVIDITERKMSEEKISYLAHHDVLTGLPNRATFSARLSAAIAKADETGIPLAVLCLDLDRFKEVNDVFGHAIGDELLRRITQRFAASQVEMARIGGDEFTAIIAGSAARERALEAAEKLIAAVMEPIEIGGRPMTIGVSIGVAMYPDHGGMEELLAKADAALYRAKAAGGNRSCLFDSEFDNKLRERRALLQDLEKAIERNELSLHYQPQAAADGGIFGFEALVRWSHPTRGDVPPSVFIAIAEERGLISSIGEWVLREACREATTWPEPLNIAVNLSPVQFVKDGLPQLVHTILLETGLAPRRLELEITEGVLVNDFARVTSILRQLKALGARVAIDDFGTGYSSLSYLRAFPFDKIKIDRSFVMSLHANGQSEAIIRAIIGLGKGLGVPQIAEGVETLEQLEFLRSAGCSEAQGYLIGRPRPIDDYADVLGRRVSKDATREVKANSPVAIAVSGRFAS
ncbi:diguanylate cyclase (GGDEF)-like protein/PAS domain S-box-containing protein [Rhodoblastus acidophilus]|uniref:EAL domain-containing protein n=1 Tax=Rhodoblastus acidophilus TaxID=1074 RepID=UPI00222538B5|nr:EAL domain-containing protein [Rhodoblastus acidophilus]MCW2318539.1 diguanylate cyclase (GGDEF)-like protein/PAS domain S-box-containing protein [Rhodoblastus acidophilus]